MRTPKRAKCAIASDLLLLTAFVAMGCGSESDPLHVACHSLPVIYGEDERQEPFASSSSHTAVALHSTVALIPTAIVRALDSGGLTWQDVTLGGADGMCADERFASQPAIAQCSGTLVATDLVLTAAHCVNGPLRCSDYTLALGYALTSATEQHPWLDGSQLYGCQNVLVDLSAADPPADVALVQLDRAVSAPWRAAPLRNASIVAGEHVLAATFPLGTPLKLDEGGQVRDVLSASFTADIDTFIHSSGGALFDESGFLAGVLVKGQDDFTFDEKAQCYRARRIEAQALDMEELAISVPAIRTALCASDIRLCIEAARPSTGTSCNNPQREEAR